MRRTLLSVLFFAVSFIGIAQKDSKTIATVNGEAITVGEFKKVYEKNLGAIDNKDGKDVAKNLDLYINYKLKVRQAYNSKLDTLRSYKREVQTYKNQLIAPYLQDKEVFNGLVKETYDRMKNEVRASHILVRLPKTAKPADTLKAYNKIKSIRNRVLAGEPFDEVARETSEDPSAKVNSGDLGFFDAFAMIYDFEDVAYKTKEGEISDIFRTQFGYHFLKRTGSRPSRGERQVAHIMIGDTSRTGKVKIDAIYNELISGKDFSELAKKFSEDRGSKAKGGMLAKFGSGKMVKSFEDAAFEIQTEGEFSKPVQSKFGWHIIKLIKKYPVKPFDEIRGQVESRVKRSGRIKISDNAVLNRLKEEYTIEEIESAKAILKRKDFRGIPKDSLQSTILKINGKEIKQSDFVRFTINRRQYSVNTLFQKFIDQEVLTYFKENLKNTDKEFANTLKEYEDGLLLFELMQRRIWNKSTDSIGLKSYFDKNMTKYDSKELDKVKGKVINDYQNFLEKEWINELRENNSVKINNKVLNKLVKYYRKES